MEIKIFLELVIVGNISQIIAILADFAKNHYIEIKDKKAGIKIEGPGLGPKFKTLWRAFGYYLGSRLADIITTTALITFIPFFVSFEIGNSIFKKLSLYIDPNLPVGLTTYELLYVIILTKSGFLQYLKLKKSANAPEKVALRKPKEE